MFDLHQPSILFQEQLSVRPTLHLWGRPGHLQHRLQAPHRRRGLAPVQHLPDRQHRRGGQELARHHQRHPGLRQGGIRILRDSRRSRNRHFWSTPARNQQFWSAQDNLSSQPHLELYSRYQRVAWLPNYLDFTFAVPQSLDSWTGRVEDE